MKKKFPLIKTIFKVLVYELLLLSLSFYICMGLLCGYQRFNTFFPRGGRGMYILVSHNQSRFLLGYNS